LTPWLRMRAQGVPARQRCRERPTGTEVIPGTRRASPRSVLFGGMRVRPVERSASARHARRRVSAFRMAPISAPLIDDVGSLLAQALDDDPAYRFLFPSAEARRRGLADFFRGNLRTHLPYHCTYVLTRQASTSTRAIEAVATVTIRPPGGVPISLATMVRRGLVPFVVRNGPLAVKRLLALVKAYDEIEAQMARGESHRLVHMMAVTPPEQGRGLGTRLLDEALALSTRASGDPRLPVLLTTHKEANVVFYRKAGFAVADERQLTLPGAPAYPVWSMRRPVPGQAQ
jgi:GNAT superfamily N-acetyltransferase